MELSSSILSKRTRDYLAEKSREAILVVGTDEFKRSHFAKLECFNFNAVRNLNYLLNKYLQVKDTHDLYMKVNPATLALPRMGEITLQMVSVAFEAKGLGGSDPLKNWFRQHDIQIATWITVKDRESAEGRAERKRHRERKHARRNLAQNVRVGRFEARRTGTHG